MPRSRAIGTRSVTIERDARRRAALLEQSRDRLFHLPHHLVLEPFAPRTPAEFPAVPGGRSACTAPNLGPH
jgi:hypothetical protein